jgi:hypothetical protein
MRARTRPALPGEGRDAADDRGKTVGATRMPSRNSACRRPAEPRWAPTSHLRAVPEPVRPPRRTRGRDQGAALHGWREARARGRPTTGRRTSNRAPSKGGSLASRQFHCARALSRLLRPSGRAQSRTRSAQPLARRGGAGTARSRWHGAEALARRGGADRARNRGWSLTLRRFLAFAPCPSGCACRDSREAVVSARSRGRGAMLRIGRGADGSAPNHGLAAGSARAPRPRTPSRPARPS